MEGSSNDINKWPVYFFSDLGKLTIYLNFMQENRKPFWADWLCAKGTYGRNRQNKTAWWRLYVWIEVVMTVVSKKVNMTKVMFYVQFPWGTFYEKLWFSILTRARDASQMWKFLCNTSVNTGFRKGSNLWYCRRERQWACTCVCASFYVIKILFKSRQNRKPQFHTWL